MPRQDISPPVLDEATKQRLLQAQEQLNNCRDWLKMCKSAGLDCEDYERQCEQLSQLSSGLIRTFVAPRRRP